MPKTVLHIIDSLETGGAEMLVAGTVVSMSAYHHIIVTLKKTNDFQKELNNLPLFCLNYESKFDLIRSVKELRAIINQHKIDIIHAHLLTSTFLARLAKKKEIPLVFSVHNTLSESAFKKSRISKWLEKLTYKSSDHIIFVSESIKKDYDKYINIKGSHDVLHNFIEDKFFDHHLAKQHQNTSPFKLVSVGSLKPQKNFSFLIQAFQHLEDCTLDIIGDGPLMNDLFEEIKHHGVQNRVKLLGNQNNIDEILTNYDLFVMASTFEGFGIAAVEAMALGIPTMLSDISVFREVADNASVFFNPNQKEDFISKLKELKTSNKKLALLSQNGHIRALQISKKSRYIKKLSYIYNQLCL